MNVNLIKLKPPRYTVTKNTRKIKFHESEEHYSRWKSSNEVTLLIVVCTVLFKQ